MFGLVHCNASILARQRTDPQLFFVRTLIKHWLWPIITCFGVTGNILAIIVLTKRRMIMSSTNNYLAALALVDIAYLILTLIINTLQHPCFNNTSISDILLTICRPIVDFSSNTSVWLTVTFTVERWVAISYPLQSRTWCTVNRARRIIISVMCAALICTSPSAFEVKLVRLVEINNATELNELPTMTVRISATTTALGNSSLYKTIYFTFVAFAIIWIPLVLLVIFNTILIIYVHRSKQNEHRNSQGIQLRRHNQGNQGEQRKTTIMLIAVVLVFTVCQIPQAISLTVQSFFPKSSQTPKVLIYNNFANCLVAINASINFLLYCCFSDRFRATFGSTFAFLTKYCVPYFSPRWKTKINKNQHSISTDNMSYNQQNTPSNYSLPQQALNSHISNTSHETNHKLACKSSVNSPLKQCQLLVKKSTSSSTSLSTASKKELTDQKKALLKQTDATHSNSLFARTTRKPRPAGGLIPESNSLIGCNSSSQYSIEKSSINHLSPTSFTCIKDSTRLYSPSMNTLTLPTYKFNSTRLYSPSMNTLTLPTYKFNSTESLKHASSVSLNTFDRIETCASQKSLNNENADEIWIKRHLSDNTIEKTSNRQRSFLWKDIVDVTV